MTDADFAAALGAATHPAEGFAALMDLAQERVGMRLFTVMRVDMAEGLARRAFTSHPEDYPASGIKPIRRNAWFATMERGEIFVAPRVQDHPDQFPDHELIARLGCGAVANLPVHAGGRLIGAANLLDAEGRWTDADAARLRDALALPALAALLAADRLDQASADSQR